MTDVTRLQTLRYALHSSATDFTSTPGTLLPLRITDDGASFLPRQRTPIERNLRSLSGRRYSHVRGAQDVADVTVATEFRGVASNTGGAVTDWEAKQEQGYLLASLFGAAAAATTGVAPTVAASGHTPSSGILAVSGLTTAAGQVIAFSTSDGLQVGRIASGHGTTTLTLEMPYTGTPTTSATVYRLGVYTVDDDLTAHTHVFFAAEGENWRRDYFGCAPKSMALTVPDTGLITMSSVFSPTTWSDVGESNPAHAEPTSGSPLVSDRVRLMIDGVEYLASGVSISYDCATAVRSTVSKTNGRLGGVSATGAGKMFKIEGQIYIGDNTGSIGELTDAAAGALLGSSDSAGDVSATVEIGLQIGTEIGSLAYAYLPTADISATVVVTNGFPMLKFSATGTGATPAIFAVG